MSTFLPHDNSMGLAQYVLARLRENADYRQQTGVDARMNHNARMREGLLSDQQAKMLGVDASVYNIGEIKCDDFTAAFYDMNGSVWDKPWKLNATPEPEVPYSTWRTVAKRLQADLKTTGVELDDEQLLELAKKYKDQANKFTRAEAKQGVARMEMRIYDQMVEADWEMTYEQMIHDMGTSPTSFSRGPIPTSVLHTRFIGDNPGIVQEVVPKTERLNYKHCFPSPDAVTPTKATNFIYVDTIPTAQLINAKMMPSFDEAAIDRILNGIEVNQNTTWWTWSGGAAWIGAVGNTGDWSDDVFTSSLAQTTNVPVVQFYGTIIGKMIKQIDLDKFPNIVIDIEDNQVYECEMWIVAEEVVRATVSPMNGMNRPIQAASFRPNPNSIWGRALLDLLVDTFNQMLTMLDDLEENLSYSARPITEIDASRFSADDVPEHVRPGSTFYTEGDPLYKQTRGVNFTSIPNNTAGILAAFDYFKKEADTITGIPSQLVGESTPSANRVGAVHSNLMRGALKKVKKIDFQFNSAVVRPMVSLFYYYNLMYSTDTSIKYDAKVHVRGTPGLIREEAKMNDNGLREQNVAELVKLGLVPAEFFHYIFRENLIADGIDPEGFIPDPKHEQLMATIRGEAAPPQGVPQGAPPDPGSSGDGRSTPIPSGAVQAPPQPA